MKNLKTINEYIKENMKSIKESIAPDAGTYGASAVILDDYEVNLFGMSEYGGKIPSEELSDYEIEPELVKLLDDNKVSIDGNELWYYNSDAATKRILRKYFLT
jgi:hypothetical protein